MNEPRKKLIHKLQYKYRLIVINDESFEEKISVKLTPLNLFVVFSTLLVMVSILTILAIFYTPLKEYVPGYTSTETKRNIRQLLYKTDSLANALKAKESYYQNVINILQGGDGLNDTIVRSSGKSNKINTKSTSYESEFRKQYEEEQLKVGSAKIVNAKKNVNQAASYFLFNPTEGLISKPFNMAESHYAIDIATKYQNPVKAVKEGTILLSGWIPQTGHTLVVQHKNNLVTIYKHNAVNLKKVGNFVNAGEVIALVGNSGEYTTGAHLHFEMWENGKPLNPAEYLNLN
jgi:murein DD-endopeptidase MepM/ murein hydrolase activator NlpD